MYQHILVTVDGSELSEQAIAHAVNVAKDGTAQVDILRVVAAPSYTVNYGNAPYGQTADGSGLFEQVAESDLTDARDYAEHKAQALRESGITATGVSVTGHPAEAILRYAEEQNVDLIVMATHGRSGLSRMRFGSVADQVLHGANVPLLLVRATGTK
jgi:nucleotide-binding universal stress UspA family protein